MRKILVIIPAYNEAESIGNVIKDLEQCHPEVDYIVINDASSDETEAVLKKLRGGILSVYLLIWELEAQYRQGICMR